MLSASKMLITSICEADSLPAAKFLKPNKMKHRVFLALNITKIYSFMTSFAAEGIWNTDKTEWLNNHLANNL